MNKFLVIQLARFGDIVQTKRLLASLAQRGEVGLCVDKSLKELAQLVFPYARVYAVPGAQAQAFEVMAQVHALGAELQAERFDEVYNLNHSGLNRSLATLFDADRVRGYAMHHGQVLRSPWVSMAFRWMSQRRAAPLNLVDFWAALASQPIAPHRVNPVATPAGKGLGVVVAGQQARRSLPAAGYAAVIKAVHKRCGGHIFLFGTQAERVAARELSQHLGPLLGQCTNLVGRTNWAELMAELCGLDVLLAPDTGTVHLAAHMGVPVEGLYCSSAWAFETGPYGLGHKVWQSAPACAPCLESAPCEKPFCRNSFADPAVLQRMSGPAYGLTTSAPRKASEGTNAAPLLLESGFDDLGLTWHCPDILSHTSKASPNDSASDISNPARSLQESQRQALRFLLAEFLGLPQTEKKLVMADPMLNALVDRVYTETDWCSPTGTTGKTL